MMVFQPRSKALAIIGVLTLVPTAGLPSVSYAQSNSECTCIVPAPLSGPAGLLSQPNGSVFISGANGLEAVLGDVELGASTAVSTGVGGSAMVTYGPTCNLALGGSTQLIVTPQNENLCVQIIEDEPDNGGFLLGLAATTIVVGGGALYVGLGGFPLSK